MLNRIAFFTAERLHFQITLTTRALILFWDFGAI